MQCIDGGCVQGYVCPGLLVVLTDSAGLAAVRAGWERGRLVSPPGYTITRLGLSPPCQVTDGREGEFNQPNC